MGELFAQARSHARHQNDVRKAVLAALYLFRVERTPPHDGRAIRHLAEATGFDEHAVRFACEVLAESRHVETSGHDWRITAAGCIAIESIFEQE